MARRRPAIRPVPEIKRQREWGGDEQHAPEAGAQQFPTVPRRKQEKKQETEEHLRVRHFEEPSYADEQPTERPPTGERRAFFQGKPQRAKRRCPKENRGRIDRHQQRADVENGRHIDHHDSPESHTRVVEPLCEPVDQKTRPKAEKRRKEPHAEFRVSEERGAGPHRERHAGALAEIPPIQPLAPFMVVGLVRREPHLCDVHEPENGENDQETEEPDIHAVKERSEGRCAAHLGTTRGPNQRQSNSASTSTENATPIPRQIPASTSLGQCDPV